MGAVDGVLAIIVRFTIAPESIDRFLALVSDNARLSKQLEPGCQRFDVLRPETGASLVVLYELYRTAEDFADHLTRPHYLEFDAATRAMVSDKKIERLGLL